MRKQLVLIIPILPAMIGMIAIVGLNTVDAKHDIHQKVTMTSGTNATNGNMTNGNATSDNMAGATNLTSSLNLFFVINYNLQKLNQKVISL